MSDVTRILSQIQAGDPSAANELLPLVYQELRALAAARLTHERPGQTLQATALVHEAYVRLIGGAGLAQTWQSRGHFFAAAAEAMRRILIENARRKQTLRRGGMVRRQAIDLTGVAEIEVGDELLELDAALRRLEQLDPSKADVVKLRYFAGLTIPQTAEALGLSITTVNRYWSYARAWLLEELGN